MRLVWNDFLVGAGAGAVAIAVAGALRGAHERALAFSDDGRAERGADLWTGPPAYT